ncbi:phosphatase PAP2 family protein [Cellvibrio sp. PSBB023]|uniref:phosphatase PAP2 family protein n=1 Tax=Cellvibrio sp. PSBB023 TaxID=1945512 RepID=UPI00098ECFFA|nr:phosphatase PAP2 family protein [Cellvibrio sp. PSBB023]AQT61952.1 hypothetical protein B0D95_18935 [Cellvibrio sp. PSBB023]
MAFGFMKLSIVITFLLIFIGLLLNLYSAQNQLLFVVINSWLPISILWIAITTVGDGAVADCIFYLFFRGRSDVLAKGLVGGTAALIASQGLKKVFSIPRPEHTEGFKNDFHLLTESMAVTNFSMSSGHTVVKFISGVLLLWYLKLSAWRKIFLIAAMIAVAISRVALGVHWPADVLVGAGVGMLIAVGCVLLPSNINNKGGLLVVHLLYLPFLLMLIYNYFL